VNALMSLLVETTRRELDTLNKNNIRLQAIGDLSRLPKKTYAALMEGIENTSANTRMTLVLAINYSARWEITEAARKIGKACADKVLHPGNINMETLAANLATAQMPDPELMIRTSGEMRISNFLLWQLAYAELYFSKEFWPDFRKEHFYRALIDYQMRERRFGMTSEQLVK
jgi:undecaprenyl diphosphate synthase